MEIALVGNPNSGKTTLFNELTGSTAHVGNWPGVTVEKKEGIYKNNHELRIQDLPGIYSLSSYSPEEIVARDYLLGKNVSGFINIVDGSHLERHLYLTMQLMELGLPMIIVVNMMDVVARNGDTIDLEALSQKLGCPVIGMSATKGNGLDQLHSYLIEMKEGKIPAPKQLLFDTKLEEAIQMLEKMTSCTKRFLLTKLLEKDEKLLNEIHDEKVNAYLDALEIQFDDEMSSIVASARYEQVSDVVRGCLSIHQSDQLSLTDRIDRIVTNRFLALPIFALVMIGVYYLSITTIGTMMTDWVNDVLFGEIIPPMVENFLGSLHASELVISLVNDGIIAGVGAVLGFLPQMIILFILLAILEDCGYMARIAFILDRLFRKFGLSGKSFIPMLIGTGCGVPGIMATRTIENENDRRMTIMLTTFIPCSAKLPIIAMIAGALFHDAWWVGPSAYFIGLAAIIVSGIILKKTKMFSGDVSPFIMELPEYHFPTLKNVYKQTIERANHFIVKAGTIIFLSSVIIWFLQTFNFKLEVVEADESILATLGSMVAWVFSPLGFGNWQATVASVTGLVAKENVVNTLAILYKFTGELSENGEEIWSTLQTTFTFLSSYSFLIFNLLCAPCFAAIGAISSEMKSRKWTVFAVLYQTGFAYVISMIFYQLGLFFTTGAISALTIISGCLVLFLMYLLFRKGEK